MRASAAYFGSLCVNVSAYVLGPLLFLARFVTQLWRGFCNIILLEEDELVIFK